MEELIEIKLVLAVDWENRKLAVRSCRQSGVPKKAKPRSPKSIPEAAFQQFWELYPRKEGKRAAEKAFYRAAERVSELSAIFEGLSTSPRLKREKQYIPHAASWLNGDGWEDEPEKQDRARVY